MIECTYCNTETDIIEAIESGWIPTHWDNDAELGPVCCDCQPFTVQLATDGEIEKTPSLAEMFSPEIERHPDHLPHPKFTR